MMTQFRTGRLALFVTAAATLAALPSMLPPWSAADARIEPPPGLAPNALNAILPDARANLGLFTVRSVGGTPTPNEITQFVTSDNSLQFQVNSNPGAVEYPAVQAGLATEGATYLCLSATPADNIDCNHTAQSAGVHNFGNGSGILFKTVDPGAPATNQVTLTPGTASTNPTLGSTDNLDIAALAGKTGRLMVGSNVAASWAVSGTPTTWPKLIGTADSLAHVEADGSASNISLFLKGKGDNGVLLANGNAGTLMSVLPSSVNTSADRLVVRAAAAAGNVTLNTASASPIELVPAVKLTGGLVTDLAVADGGTGAGTAREAARNLGVPYLLCKSGVAAAAAADTAENTLATCTVPAGAMGANGQLRVRANYTASGAGGSRTVRVRFSGASGTIIQGFGAASGATDITVHANIANKNNTGNQTGSGWFSINTATQINTSASSPAVDTTASSTIVITCQKASAGDDCTLRQYLVELLADGT